MNFKLKNIIWGICFIALGILFFGKAFFGFDINIGNLIWRLWPLFIAIPSAISVLRNGPKTSSLIGLFIGVIFLLLTNNLVSGDIIKKLIVPSVFVIIGISFIFKDAFSSKSSSTVERNTNAEQFAAVFSSTQAKFPHDIFSGAKVDSVFGSVVLDLRDAIITNDVIIDASVIFAGADIYVPSNVNVKVSSIPIFGGVSNKVPATDCNGPTIFINATCMFGGLEIK